SFSLANGFADVFGISGANNLFKPGTLTGSIPTLQPNAGRAWYNTDMSNFAPSLGLAWQPELKIPLIKDLLPGGGKTVFRAGYSISYPREGFNNFTSTAFANPGIDAVTNVNPITAPCSPASTTGGSFNAGCVTFNGLIGGQLTTLSPFPTSPTTPFAIRAFFGNPTVNAFDPNLRTPRVQSWSAGIQREFGHDTVLEIRYVANHSTGLWRQDNINEVNIFENGFLNEFKLAKANLDANIAGGCGSRFNPMPG